MNKEDYEEFDNILQLITEGASTEIIKERLYTLRSRLDRQLDSYWEESMGEDL